MKNMYIQFFIGSDKKEVFKQPQKSFVSPQIGLKSNTAIINKRRLRSPVLDITTQPAAIKKQKIDRRSKYKYI